MALKDLASLLERKARIAAEEPLVAAVADVADEVGLPRRAREELGIHCGDVESRHRPAIEAERPRRGGKPHNYFNVFDTLSEDLPLFPCLDGRVLADLGKHHDRLLDDALSKQFDEGLLHIDGKRMSLSSWRHTHVTEMLSILAKKKTPNLVSFLAKNIGSSEAMIEKHYGHLIPEMARDELRV